MGHPISQIGEMITYSMPVHATVSLLCRDRAPYQRPPRAFCAVNSASLLPAAPRVYGQASKRESTSTGHREKGEGGMLRNASDGADASTGTGPGLKTEDFLLFRVVPPLCPWPCHSRPHWNGVNSHPKHSPLYSPSLCVLILRLQSVLMPLLHIIFPCYLPLPYSLFGAAKGCKRLLNDV